MQNTPKKKKKKLPACQLKTYWKENGTKYSRPKIDRLVAAGFTPNPAGPTGEGPRRGNHSWLRRRLWWWGRGHGPSQKRLYISVRIIRASIWAKVGVGPKLNTSRTGHTKKTRTLTVKIYVPSLRPPPRLCCLLPFVFCYQCWNTEGSTHQYKGKEVLYIYVEAVTCYIVVYSWQSYLQQHNKWTPSF